MMTAVINPSTQSPVERLITALRSPLPQGFEWDFGWYENCALGLALRTGIITWDDAPDEKLSAVLGGISVQPLSSREIDGLVPLYGVPARAVTPVMVADALEKLVSPSPSHDEAIPVVIGGRVIRRVRSSPCEGC